MTKHCTTKYMQYRIVCVCVVKSENDQWVCPQLQKNAEQGLGALIRLHCATKSCLILNILEIFIKRLTKEKKKS